ncbi:hypothetical protein LTR95_018016, partial [Oleoguttula sp. CCFEE 5521]
MAAVHPSSSGLSSGFQAINLTQGGSGGGSQPPRRPTGDVSGPGQGKKSKREKLLDSLREQARDVFSNRQTRVGVTLIALKGFQQMLQEDPDCTDIIRLTQRPSASDRPGLSSRTQHY